MKLSNNFVANHLFSYLFLFLLIAYMVMATKWVGLSEIHHNQLGPAELVLILGCVVLTCSRVVILAFIGIKGGFNTLSF
jgi:hypothetical protein